MPITEIQKEKLTALMSRRDKHFQRLQVLVDIAKKLTKENLSTFKARLQNIDKTYEDFERVIDEINNLCASMNESDRVDTSKVINSFDEMYYFVKAVADDHSELLVSNRKQSADVNTNVKLPKIDLPRFDGCLMNWPHFRDSFTSLIHNNHSLKAIDKFNYLRASLAGVPLEIISSIPFEANGYIQAWEVLMKHFDDPRVLATHYLENILNFTPLEAEGLTELQRFLSVFRENVSALQKLTIPDLAQFILLHLGLKKLDANTCYTYEKEFAHQPFPTCASLITLVESKCKILQLNSIASHALPVQPGRGKAVSLIKTKKVHTFISTEPQDRCPLCYQSHKLIKCSKFGKLTPSKRFQVAKRLNLCFNCLSEAHRVSDCASTHSCRECQKQHHSLLHFPTSKGGNSISSVHTASLLQKPSLTDAPSSLLTGIEASALQSSTVCSTSSQVLLGTILLNIKDSSGFWVPFRAVLDSGSQKSFLTKSFVCRLGFQPFKSRVMVAGIGGGNSLASLGVVKSLISPHFSKQLELDFKAEILSNLTSMVPVAKLDPQVKSKFRSLELADPTFDTPGPIDGLLGNDVFLQILSPNQNYLNSLPAALSTTFGLVVMGPLDNVAAPLATSLSVDILEPSPESLELSEALRGFWELEEPFVKLPDDPRHVACERHFVETHSRDSLGRYIVRLPFVDDSRRPTNNKQAALNRLYSLERRLGKTSKKGESYNDFLREYLQLGHMELTQEPSKYTIPYHVVFRPDSTTTKIRVVFDASAAAVGDTCLNSCLLSGPVLQLSLADIVCNFRLHKVAFAADICKMYRQVLIHADDQCFQHIVWRESVDEPVETFALKTVTYGLSSASFLAIRVLFQLTIDEGPKYPLAVRVLREDVYVDDIVSGAEDDEAAILIQQQVTNLCRAGGFTLQKWLSNSPVFMDSVSSQNDPASTFPLVSDVGSLHKVLGVQWNPMSDDFFYSFSSLEVGCTKRQILSDVSKLFDPLGWIAPVVFFAKCVMQRLWRLKLDWDEVVPARVLKSWQMWVSELPQLGHIRIPRRILLDGHNSCHILGFSDASELGYGCAVYVRSANSFGGSQTYLLKARTKVAPLKLQTIPRLELCGAVLLVRTLIGLQDCLKRFPHHTVRLWTDSSVVLSWLSMEPQSLKTFVAHRVAEINCHFPSSYWGHVASQDNPADLASRGVLPQEIRECSLWWQGPAWCSLEPNEWPKFNMVSLAEVPEIKQSSLIVAERTANEFELIFSRYSTLSRLQRVLAWCSRFLNNAKPNTRRATGPLSLGELRGALQTCIRIAQRNIGTSPPQQRSVRLLAPFLDSSGILRVGGRLSNAALSWSAKHPILLKKQSPLSKLIIQHYHRAFLHVGANTLQALLSREYWIVAGRSLIRKLVRECPVCWKFRAKPKAPLMGDLPEFRVKAPGRAFAHVGVDFAGPLAIRLSQTRKTSLGKAYICVFVCLATKALHVELVSALTTEAFMACLDRFVSRRGGGPHFYSDQGRNFIGAARQLRETRDFLLRLNDPAVDLQLSKRNIVWHFNPPLSPNFGGMWEAAVKAIKTHLIRLLEPHRCTFEELQTALTKIEAILNSRPLCPLSNDPEDFDFLTPGHFLIGGPLTSLPEAPLSSISTNRLTRWKLIQQVSQGFWKRWNLEYLHTLQQRKKWYNSSANLREGDLVLIKTPSSPPTHWSTGRILQTFPGSDGVVRVVTVRTPTGVYKRPASAIAPFPSE